MSKIIVNGETMTIGGEVTQTAEEVPFDNQPTTLESSNVQKAIEELDGKLATKASQESVDELFTSVSNGKVLIASAITDMGVPTDKDATWEQMKENILSIVRVVYDGQWWSPKMTSNTTPSPYVASASSVYSSGFPAWYAFDGIPALKTGNNTGGYWMTPNGGGTDMYVQIDLGKAITVAGFKICAIYLNTLVAITQSRMYISGSNNGTAWTEIANYTNIEWPGEWETYKSFILSGLVSYRYFRFGVKNVGSTENTYGREGFSDIQFYIPN